MAVMGGWRPLSGEIANSFGQGKCTFNRGWELQKPMAVATMIEQAHAF